MLWPAHAILEEVQPYLPRGLVGEPELARCRRIADRLPDLVTSYYMECRLDEDPEVDFLVQVRDSDRVAASFGHAVPAETRSRSWNRNLALFRRWGDGTAHLCEVPLMWLEYDIDAAFDAQVPQASPSIGLERGYLARFRSRANPDLGAALRRASAGLAELVDGTQLFTMEATLSRCVASLPPGGSLIYLSVMNARTPSLLKLYISVPKTRALDYLDAIGWSGTRSAAQDVLGSAYGPIEETVFLDVSIEDGVLPRLGFALSQLHTRELQEFDPAWSWVAMPSVCDRKRRELRAWPGISEAVIGGNQTWVQRWVDLKIVLGASGDLRFKAYLGFMPMPPPLFSWGDVS